MGSKGSDDPWAGLPNGIRIKTQNSLVQSGFGSNNILGDIGNTNFTEAIYVDGKLLDTPVANYVFDDDNIHNVLVIPKNFDTVFAGYNSTGIGYYSNSPMSYIDIPVNIVDIRLQAIRGFDTGVDCVLIIRSTSVVTFGNANFLGTPSKCTIYVPANLVNDYKALFTAGDNNFPAGYADRIFALENSPYK